MHSPGPTCHCSPHNQPVWGGTRPPLSPCRSEGIRQVGSTPPWPAHSGGSTVLQGPQSQMSTESLVLGDSGHNTYKWVNCLQPYWSISCAGLTPQSRHCLGGLWCLMSLPIESVACGGVHTARSCSPVQQQSGPVQSPPLPPCPSSPQAAEGSSQKMEN